MSSSIGFSKNLSDFFKFYAPFAYIRRPARLPIVEREQKTSKNRAKPSQELVKTRTSQIEQRLSDKRVSRGRNAYN
jgi:hypothetical protein